MLLLQQMTEKARLEGWLDQLIVAQFNHGTRPSAQADQDLVVRVARALGVKCETGHTTWEKKWISEAEAREARYEFLESVKKKYAPAEIWTAQHLDDLTETITINLLRGTGWRGLAAMNRSGVRRPWLETESPLDRTEIWRQAGERELVFREDPTNQEEIYLRNRVRRRLVELSRAQKLELWQRWQRQKELRQKIEQLVAELIPSPGEEWQRDWFRDLEPVVAWELLRMGLIEVDVHATRPQLEEFRRAILDYAPGRKFNLPGGRLVKLGRTGFSLEK